MNLKLFKTFKQPSTSRIVNWKDKMDELERENRELRSKVIYNFLI